MEKQRPAGNGLMVFGRVGKPNKQRPPVVYEGNHYVGIQILPGKYR